MLREAAISCQRLEIKFRCAENMKITEVEAFLLATPLETPYVSSLGSLDRLTSALVQVSLSDGAQGFSEVTPVRGYNEESIEEIWAAILCWAPRLVGRDAAQAFEQLHAASEQTPYACSAPAVAIELALAPASRGCRAGPRFIPLVAPVLSTGAEAIRQELSGLRNAGYRTLKAKAGMNLSRDHDRIACILEQLYETEKLRIDFNGACNAQDAIAFVSTLDARRLEFVEQPCAADDWDGNERVACSIGVPTMLDESIKSGRDVERAGRSGAFRFVKMKLGKFPTLRSLQQAYAAAARHQMTGILGNGAATDVACAIEAAASQGQAGIADEMNGFLKNTAQYLASPLEAADGAMLLRPQSLDGLNRGALLAHAVGHVRFT